MIGRISVQQASSLLNKEAKLRNDLKLSESDSANYYQLSDGQILLHDIYDCTGVLFPSEQVLADFRKKVISKKEKHILEGVFKDKKDFHNKLSSVEISLSKFLQLNPSLLDSTFDSLSLIDKRIKQISLEDYLTKVYSFLICYVGKVILKEKGGTWMLVKNSGIVEPSIKLPSKKMINFFIDLYEYAVEDYENFSSLTISQLRLDSF